MRRIGPVRGVLGACALFLTLPALTHAGILVDNATPIRYRANSSNPSLGTGWTAEAFNDSGWDEGLYGIGYQDGSSAHSLITTYVPIGTVSVYTRATIEIPSATAISQLFLGADYDDAYAVWINGVEVYRSPELPATGPLDWNSPVSLHESSNADYPDYGTPIDISTVGIPELNDGTNLIAIGLWNDGPTSSDLVVVPRVYADSPAAFRLRGPYLQRGSDSAVTVRWDTDLFADSRVRHGTAPDNLTQVVDEPALVRRHEVELTGLTPDTLYYYSVGTTTEVLAGGDSAHSFRTAPTPGTRRPVRIWAIGDSGTANDDAAAVRDAYREFAGDAPTDLWLMLGDNAYDDGTDDEYQSAVFQTYPRLLRASVLWPTLGNHDGHSVNSPGQTGPYYDIFTLPTTAEAGGMASGTEAYYSFDYANIHFICLDSYDLDRSPGSAMMSWLLADVASTNQDWIIAFWHHPPYSRGNHDSDTTSQEIEMRQYALPTLESFGVDLVLGGHSHSYERSFLIDGHYGPSGTFNPSMMLDGGDGRIDGTGAYQKTSQGPGGNEGAVYTVAGSSGKTESGGSLDHPVMFTSLLELGSVVLDVDGDRLQATFLDDHGVVRDHYTIVKNTGTPPVADFTAIPVAGLAPLLVAFEDASTTNAATWDWDLFGSGTTSTVQNTSAVYLIPGQYDVTLTAGNAAGSDQELKTVHICVSGGAPAEVSALELQADGTTLTWDPVTGATSYDLVKGDLTVLRTSAGDFTAAFLGCLVDDAVDPLGSDASPPGAGQAFFYVARGTSCNLPGTYDSGAATQIASRDAAVASAAGACP